MGYTKRSKHDLKPVKEKTWQNQNQGKKQPATPVRRTPDSQGARKPNILVIWGDDIGISNLSCYTHGLMGYQTPNIDRLANEGMMFTDSYGEQSCTAGRSSFITGPKCIPHRPF